MKKSQLLTLSLLILLLLPILTSCEAVTGSGELDSWEMTYTDFSRLEISNWFEASISRGDTYSITITIDKVLYEYLDINQRGDRVQIGLKGGRTYSGTTQRADIVLPELKRLELSGGASGIIDGFSDVKFIRFDAVGGSRLTLNNLTANEVEINLSDGSRAEGCLVVDKAFINCSDGSSIRLTGSAGEMSLTGSGGSKLLLSNFTASTANIKLGGVSYGDINIKEQINLDLSGASQIDYQGEPRFGSIKVSGGSTINQK